MICAKSAALPETLDMGSKQCLQFSAFLASFVVLGAFSVSSLSFFSLNSSRINAIELQLFLGPSLTPQSMSFTQITW